MHKYLKYFPKNFLKNFKISKKSLQYFKNSSRLSVLNPLKCFRGFGEEGERSPGDATVEYKILNLTWRHYRTQNPLYSWTEYNVQCTKQNLIAKYSCILKKINVLGLCIFYFTIWVRFGFVNLLNFRVWFCSDQYENEGFGLGSVLDRALLGENVGKAKKVEILHRTRFLSMLMGSRNAVVIVANIQIFNIIIVSYRQ